MDTYFFDLLTDIKKRGRESFVFRPAAKINQMHYFLLLLIVSE